jgi:hypothetical protein
MLAAIVCCTEHISRDMFATNRSRRQKKQITDYASADNLKLTSMYNVRINLWYQYFEI